MVRWLQAIHPKWADRPFVPRPLPQGGSPEPRAEAGAGCGEWHPCTWDAAPQRSWGGCKGPLASAQSPVSQDQGWRRGSRQAVVGGRYSPGDDRLGLPLHTNAHRDILAFSY